MNLNLSQSTTQRISQITQQLEQDNIQAVGLWLENAEQFACALLACLNAKVKVLLPPNLLAENQQWVAENADLFLTSQNFAEYGILQKSQQNPPLVDKNNPTEIWLKTSGSSGNAKIIVKTAKQMWQEAKALAQIIPFKQNAIQLLGSVSVQHLYGLTFRIFLGLEMGWKMGQEQLQYPEFLIAESKIEQPSLWVSSPALLTNLNLDNPELTQCHLAGIISSGGALPEEVGNAIRAKLNVPVLEIYGSSETGVIAYRTDSNLWQAMPTSQMGTDENGALWVENSWIAQREQTADAVEISEQGFKLLGRIDRIVKLGDKRVSLVKIEQDLLKHGYVADCYIALHPKQKRAVAWIALSAQGIECFKQQGRKAVIEQLKLFLTDTQEKFALPRFWRFCDKLPRNSQSKISRADFEAVCLNPAEENF
ncbi:AMP-binding protein [Pasteurellaceae bacterium 15-036681]|nr:AMP-binding protein [Pasteurellaceae bacterium 15-036681]